MLLTLLKLEIEHMFSDESINIHYRSPTSKLLKMNTFNEFELNRIKKFYNQELTNRLERSKSGRLPQSLNAPKLIPVGHHFRESFMTSGEPGSGSVDLHRYQHAFLAEAGKRQARYGRALFDFQAKNERELSLKRGDLLRILEALDHTWARVEDCQSGLQGLVPLSYVDYSVGCAVAKRDVTANQMAQRGTIGTGQTPLLPMKKGEPITLIRRLKGHWYEASNTRQVMGVVWSSDLDIIKQPVLSGSQCTQQMIPGDEFSDDGEDDEVLILESGERVLARRRARSASGRPSDWQCYTTELKPSDPCYWPTGYESETEEGDHLCAVSGAHTTTKKQPRRSSSSPYISTAVQQQVSAMDSQSHSRQLSSRSATTIKQVRQTPSLMNELPHLCRAKYPYKPRQKDELELMVGDVLIVLHRCDDGWFIGSSYATKEMGTFPGNFVEPI